MTLIAAVVLDPASIATWIMIGIVLGWFAGQLFETASYGAIGDLLVGGVGGLVGGFVFGLFAGNDPSYWWTAVAAIVSSGVVIALARFIVARNA